MFIYIYVYICIHVYIRIHLPMYPLYIYMCVYMHKYIELYVHTHVSVFPYMCICNISFCMMCLQTSTPDIARFYVLQLGMLLSRLVSVCCMKL